jgi:hypothetical protein
MIEIEDAVATSLEDLDFIVEPFHKTTILNLLHPTPNFGLRLLLRQVHIEDCC